MGRPTKQQQQIKQITQLLKGFNSDPDDRGSCLEMITCFIGLFLLFIPGKFLISIAALWINFTKAQLYGWSIAISFVLFIVYWIIGRKGPYKSSLFNGYKYYSCTCIIIALLMLLIYLIGDGTALSYSIKNIFLKTLWL